MSSEAVHLAGISENEVQVEETAVATIINPLEISRIAWEGVIRNKVRSLLTMLGVIIGVGAVIIMIAISAGTEATIAEQIEGLGSNLVFIQAGFGRGAPGSNSNQPSLVYDDIAIVESVSGVAGTTVDQTTSQTVKAGDVTLTDVALMGTTPDFPDVRDVVIADGRFFNETELERSTKVAVLGSSLAEQLFGDANPIGQSITVGTTKLAVIGVAEEKGIVGNTDFDSLLYVPITLVFDRFLPTQFQQLAGDRVRIIYVQVEPEADMDLVIQQIQLKLANSKDVSVDELPFTMQTQQDIIDTEGATTEAFRNLLAWVAGVSLLVGGIGIMNIMLVSVTERTREIGIRQSVGATPNDIRLQFLTEALMLSLVGGLIGVAIGVGGSYLFGSTSDMRTVIVPSSIALAFGSAAAVGIFFGFFPANKAAQLDPIEALRHE
ncbi:ABC transporter permease [Candidatus Leptofilum sp.]|uniref:ABC transporter permease n=1 Tax=Candidatus Leptofilum sp. TaxID=3241576 RepID=UPI003B5AADAF